MVRQTCPTRASHVLPIPPSPNVRKNANVAPKRPFVLSDVDIQHDYDVAVENFKKQKAAEKEKEKEKVDEEKARKAEEKRAAKLKKLEQEANETAKRQSEIEEERVEAKKFVDLKKQLNKDIKNGKTKGIKETVGGSERTRKSFQKKETRSSIEKKG